MKNSEEQNTHKTILQMEEFIKCHFWVCFRTRHAPPLDLTLTTILILVTHKNAP